MISASTHHHDRAKELFRWERRLDRFGFRWLSRWAARRGDAHRLVAKLLLEEERNRANDAWRRART